MSLAIAFLSTGEAREGELMVLKNEYHKLKKKTNFVSTFNLKLSGQINVNLVGDCVF